MHLTCHFSHAFCTLNYMHITLHGSRRATRCVCVRVSFHLHVIHDVCLIVRWLLPRSVFLLFLSVVYSALPHSSCTLPGTSSSMSTTPRVKTAAPPLNEEYCPMAKNNPLTSDDRRTNEPGSGGHVGNGLHRQTFLSMIKTDKDENPRLTMLQE